MSRSRDERKNRVRQRVASKRSHLLSPPGGCSFPATLARTIQKGESGAEKISELKARGKAPPRKRRKRHFWLSWPTPPFSISHRDQPAHPTSIRCRKTVVPDGEFKKAPRDSCSVHALESSSPTKLDMLHNSKHSTPNSECSPQDLSAGPPPAPLCLFTHKGSGLGHSTGTGFPTVCRHVSSAGNFTDPPNRNCLQAQVRAIHSRRAP